MNAGLRSQGLTLGAEEAVRQGSLAPAPAAWLACLQSAGFDLSAFQQPFVASWRETLALSLLGSEAGSQRLPDMEALELLRSHHFQTLPPSDGARLRQMLARIARRQ